MRRVVVSAVAALGVTGCSSFSTDSFTSYLKPTLPAVSVQIDSVPSGADAVTSLGPGCQTPCWGSVPAENFSVPYTLPRFPPLTVPVQVINIPGDFSAPASTTIDPNPVVGELQPAGPAPKAARKPMRPKKPKPKPASAAPAGSPVPAPAAPAPAPSR